MKVSKSGIINNIQFYNTINQKKREKYFLSTSILLIPNQYDIKKGHSEKIQNDLLKSNNRAYSSTNLTPGSSLPSIYSSIAPPPVET